MNTQNLYTLPEGWEIKRLEEVAIINPTRGDKYEDSDEVTFLGMTDVSDEGKMVSPQVKTYGEVKSGFTRFSDNDVLVAKITPCFENGKGALVTNLRNGIGFGSTEFHVIRVGPLVDKKFVFYHSVTHEFRQRGKQQMSGSAGQQRVPSEFLRSYKLSLPPLPEQRRIAAVLGTWDLAIEQTQKLLKAIRIRHRGLMQQLLTGKKRLPGYEDEWQKNSYENLLKEVKRNIRFNDNEFYHLISVRRRSGGLFHRQSLYGYQILTKNLRQAKKGDFLFSKMQIVHGASGLTTKEFDGMMISGSYIAVVARDTNVLEIEFLNWFSQLPYFYHQTWVSSYGVHIEKMTFDFEAFLGLSMDVPPTIEEQKAITRVLDASLKEVRQYESKLEALREQKRGLMQCLLTGQKQIPLPAEII